ncbi:DNA topoisomerase IV subunit A [Hirschia baltica]|uniref:DNA topoisomerase 4 subunit A n=1 Tax=Hirschia baltica (strain ATCC 49814 / DSM 5838 / IFAM 1418) TaxID=582402 RepID=C6XIU3_HIRBI|nr:DNA topoisomerase IV subunit A [Hirschia baltica]ACT59038.1 DNA topoisomerase IV, A subunit [Hirschia baltica ATCC 49814]
MSDEFKTDDQDNGIIEEPMSDALSKRYLAYALSTITSRALPDVRDGLKPVHRRLMYAMRLLKLNPELAFKKSARVVGDVIGKYHPHGDASIYDALVRLAQDFNVRYPLVDGQGNFGNIDGDSAAAMRYTESRLTPAAQLLLEGLDENAVDFKETYDGGDKEPVVLASGFPNLLCNGSSGIAVGMATSIPPHNAAETIDACIHLIENKSATTADLVKIMPGPDFPTGGEIVEDEDSILKAYETGRGGFRMRCKWEKEDLPRGLWQIVVTEIPYQVQKSKLIERLAELIETKKAPLLDDVMDESAEDIRVVLVPRNKLVDPDVLMASLYKMSDLESRFSLNMNVLDHNVPRVMGLKQVLQCYLAHRQEVIVRRAQHRLDKIEARLHILEGYLKAYLNIDEVIRIIRYEDHPKEELMKAFKLSEIQTDAILNMRLRALRKLEEIEIQGEHDKLTQERDKLVQLIGSEARQWTEVKRQLKIAREVFDPESDLGRRRSKFGVAVEIDADAALEAMIPKEPITVILSKMGWIRALKGHNQAMDKLKFKDGDELAFTLECQTTDKVVLLASGGKAFTFAADKLPSGRGHGEPIRLSIDLPEDEEIIATITPKTGYRRVVASTAGYGFVVNEEELVSQKRGGKVIQNPPDGATFAFCPRVEGDMVAVIGDNKKILFFPLEELPEMARGKGVKLQNYKQSGLINEQLMDICTFDSEDGFFWKDTGGRNISLNEWRDWLGKRAAAGKLAPKGFNRTGKFS